MTEDKTETTYSTYTVYYIFKEQEWCFSIQAKDEEEAELRLLAIKQNSVLGDKILFTIQIPKVFNNLVISFLSMFSSLKNFFK
jgi:hypothetical protein